MIRYRQQVKGFSLVELMIALALGLLLAAGVVTVYVNSVNNFSQDEEVARLQENARFALRLLSKDLSMMGFYGGIIESGSVGNTDIAIAPDCGGGWETDMETPLTFVNDATGAAANAELTCIDAGDVYNNATPAITPDVIAIKRVAGSETLEDGVWNAALGASQAGFTDVANQIYLRVVYETNTVDFIQSGTANLADDAVDGSGVHYWKYLARAFFIQSFSQAGDGVPTLCAENLRGAQVRAECFVEGVENMQFEFGVDSDFDGVANYFTDDPTAAELGSSVAVRIYLLMRSINQMRAGLIQQQNRSYQMGNTGVVGPFNDRFYRRVFSTTVLLKNRFVF